MYKLLVQSKKKCHAYNILGVLEKHCAFEINIRSIIFLLPSGVNVFKLLLLSLLSMRNIYNACINCIQ